MDGDMAVTGGNRPASHSRTNHTNLPFAQYGEAGRQKKHLLVSGRENILAYILQKRITCFINACFHLAGKKSLLVSGREDILAYNWQNRITCLYLTGR